MLRRLSGINKQDVSKGREERRLAAGGCRSEVCGQEGGEERRETSIQKDARTGEDRA